MTLSILLQTAARGYLFASEKIFAVLTVVLLILAGFLALLLLTNRRISRLERMMEQAKGQSTDSNSTV